MNRHKILHALAVAAVLALPTAAFAQQPPFWYYNNSQAYQMNQSERKFFEALRTINLSPEQQEQVRNIVSHPPTDPADARYQRREITAILSREQRQQLTAQLRAENGRYGQYPNGQYPGQYPGGQYPGQYPGGQYPGQYPGGQYPGGYGQNGALNGVVNSFSPFNLYLQNGTHVELHQGTVINPTGTTLQPGMRVNVYGHWNNDGTYSADTINVISRY